MNKRIICIVLSALMMLELTGCMGSRPMPTPSIEVKSNDGTEKSKVPDDEHASMEKGLYTQEDYKYRINDDGSVTIIKYLGVGGDVVVPATLDGKSVTAIGYTIDDFKGAFQDCIQLTSVIIPDGVTEIKDNAFYDCIGLTTVTVPVSVKVIWNCAFSGCTSLEAIYFEGDAPQFANYVLESSEPVLYYHEGASGWTNPFYGCVTAIY